MRPSVEWAAASLRRASAGDHLSRGSLALLTNNLVLAALGMAFWAVAAGSYTAEVVGRFAALNGALTLLGTVAALGLPTAALRFLPGLGPAAGRIVAGWLAAIATLGAGLGALVALGIGAGSGSSAAAGWVGLAAALGVVLAISGVCDAWLVAARRTGALVMANAVGASAKLLALILLADSGLAGLVLAFALGACAQTLISGLAAWAGERHAVVTHQVPTARARHTFAVGGYLGAVVGIIPVSTMPLLVISVQGAEDAAYFAVAWLIASGLGVIAGAAAQVMLAEASRNVAQEWVLRRRALRWVYGLEVPLVAAIGLTAPIVLGVFGSDYADAGTSCLRLLCLGALISAANYVYDAAIAVHIGGRGYLAVNAVNMLLVLGSFAVLLPLGLTEAALGWTIGQALSLIAAMAILKCAWTPRGDGIAEAHA